MMHLTFIEQFHDKVEGRTPAYSAHHPRTDLTWRIRQFCETLDNSLCTRFPSRVITLEKEQLTVRVRTSPASSALLKCRVDSRSMQPGVCLDHRPHHTFAYKSQIILTRIRKGSRYVLHLAIMDVTKVRVNLYRGLAYHDHDWRGQQP
jgi:hypothetical protein